MSSSPTEKILRPPNAFLIYRSYIGARLPPPPPGATRDQRDVSRIAGEMWRAESSEVKDDFRRQAALMKAEHVAKYPDYKFGRTSKNGRGGPKKGKGTQGGAVVVAPPNFDGALGGSQGLHYSPALPELDGNVSNVYPDYCEAIFDSYHPPYDESVYFDDFNTSRDHDDAFFDYYLPPGNQSVCPREGAWWTDQGRLQPQNAFGDEQELVLHTLQGLSYQQLMELSLSV